MKKSIFALIALFAIATTSAFACDPGSACVKIAPNLVNTASICNQVTSSASVTGVGSSYSYATGSATAIANGGQVITSPGSSSRTMELTGTTTTTNYGLAYNVSTGSGATGSATSTGTANASMINSQTSTYLANGVEGSLHMQATTVSASNINIKAGTNQGGTSTATTTGLFDVNGSLSGSAVNFFSNVPQTSFENGTLTDSKTTLSQVTNTRVNVNGTVLNKANTLVGNAKTTVNASGDLSDPAQ
jgi:hypothetical protein